MICTDGHFPVCGSDASFSGCSEETRDGHTSLGAGAAEGSDGAQEDDEGHKSSHSNADDHCHWERLCREQQKEASCDRYILHTLPVDVNRACSAAHTARLFFRTHIPQSVCSRQELREELLYVFILLSDILPQAQGHALKTAGHEATEKDNALLHKSTLQQFETKANCQTVGY